MHWFKSYGDFNKDVDVAHWWRCIGKGLQSMGLACLDFITTINAANKNKTGGNLCFMVGPLSGVEKKYYDIRSN